MSAEYNEHLREQKRQRVELEEKLKLDKLAMIRVHKESTDLFDRENRVKRNNMLESFSVELKALETSHSEQRLKLKEKLTANKYERKSHPIKKRKRQDDDEVEEISLPMTSYSANKENRKTLSNDDIKIAIQQYVNSLSVKSTPSAKRKLAESDTPIKLSKIVSRDPMSEINCNTDQSINAKGDIQAHTSITQWYDNDSTIELDMQCYSDNSTETDFKQTGDDAVAYVEDDFQLLDEFNSESVQSIIQVSENVEVLAFEEAKDFLEDLEYLDEEN